MWIIVDNAFDLFIVDTYTMVTHKKDAIIIVKHLYWGFAYDVIKNMIIQIMIDLSQILIWPIRP